MTPLARAELAALRWHPEQGRFIEARDVARVPARLEAGAGCTYLHADFPAGTVVDGVGLALEPGGDLSVSLLLHQVPATARS